MNEHDDVVERLRREAAERAASTTAAPRETPRQIFAQLALEAERALGPRVRWLEPQLTKVERLVDELAAAPPTREEHERRRRALAEALDKLEHLCDAMLDGAR
ncbi:MAG TPA: hypothetical protein VFF06_20955 [Polyangia bacterium]|nr:hypothetical protein [Polyangia bacterium]